MNSNPSIVWLRQDLRLADNPALDAARQLGPVLPVYILDEVNAGDWAMGGASRWWLHHSLTALNSQLDGKLWVLAGDPLLLLPQLAREQKVRTVVWNRCYEPWRRHRDNRLEAALHAEGLTVQSFNASLLWEPLAALKRDGSPYRVFTPYYRNALTTSSIAKPLPAARGPLRILPCPQPGRKIDRLALLPQIPWYKQMAQCWTPGEAGAQRRLQTFLAEGIAGYREGRDYPSRAAVSRLSPHLHFGEVSPRQLWQQALAAGQQQGLEQQAEHFQRELAWREFSHSLLYHYPTLSESNLNRRFDNFPWQQQSDELTAWQQGRTGYPIVDAGMRELWQTGYMHNRVRMIVGSFLVKNLLLHWRLGARWFWDCLLDADLANNSCSWQWVAGCGADAAPYFRIFNPTTQAQKFDPDGAYIRRHLPELAGLPNRYIHDPANAPQSQLTRASIKLDRDYPAPIVELKSSRERALAAYKSLSG